MSEEDKTQLRPRLAKDPDKMLSSRISAAGKKRVKRETEMKYKVLRHCSRQLLEVISGT